MAHRKTNISIFMSLVAAGTGEERFAPVTYTGSKLKIQKVRLVADETVAADASNYTTLTLNKGVAGSAIASWSTQTSADGALTKGVDQELTLSGSGTTLELADGDVVEFDKADSGTGAAFQGTVVLECEEQPLP